MQSIIHLENIRKSYYLGKAGITRTKGISLDVYRNEYVALMGPNGSGKSRLMNIWVASIAPAADGTCSTERRKPDAR